MKICSRLDFRTILLECMALVVMPAATAQARPAERSSIRPTFEFLDLQGRRTDFPPGESGVFTGAQSGTTWFGGTVWAADSMRWEAIEGQLWTFDTGVGSSLVPPGGPGDLSAPTRDWINPYKQPGLHATMEGWVGFDKTYAHFPYFRRLASTDPRWDGVCVGSPAGLSGTYSLWAGVFREEAEAFCYRSGQGYGNGWTACVEHPFTYSGGPVALDFTYRNDTEPDFDFSIVYVDSGGEDVPVEAVSYTGEMSGTAHLTLTQGIELPVVTPKPIKIKFCLQSDGAWSDEDGLYSTTCGAFAVDDITVSGGGINHQATFEASGEGWGISPSDPGQGEEWSSLHALSELPPSLAPCPCALTDSVLAFPDDSNGHPRVADNLAASPWIDLAAAGLAGSPGKILKTNLYVHLPLLNYVFAQFEAQWYPALCLRTGKLITSPWTSNGFVYYYGGTPQCTTLNNRLGTQIDFSTIIPPSAEQVRMAVGVINYNCFFGECFPLNSSPWFDEVGLGVYGVPGAPYIHAEAIDRPQDNFPANGTLNLNAPGRVDCNNIQGDTTPEPWTTLGDTLIVWGTADDAEVYVHFRVTPGPGTNASAFNSWWSKHSNSPVEAGFKVARCDTSEWGGFKTSGAWMTAYHEADPNFSGTDRDLDPTDQAPNGGNWRLRNDIFPDDLFTMGSRIDLFYTANTVGEVVYYRDPTAPSNYEMEIVPSSATAGGDWNCVLYVDHFEGGAQGYIETALIQILGTGSENFESTNWDRFDVNAPTSGQMSVGGPINTEYGMSVVQLLAYKVILWDTGNLNAFNLTKEDADALNPWLTLLDYDFNNLYLSGDGLVYSVGHAVSEPSAQHLVEDLAGVTLRAGCAVGSFRAANCPYPGAPADLTSCVDLIPVAGAVVAGSGGGRGVGHVGQGNGCPDNRAFDVLDILTPDFGASRGDERYDSAIKGARFASTSTNAASSGTLNFKVVVDGLSVHYRRNSGSPCDYELGNANAVAERLEEVLTYFGYGSAALCDDNGPGIGITDEGTQTPPWQTTLSEVFPNPLPSGSLGRVRFTLARGSRAVVDVYDLQGRLVKTVFDGIAREGENEAIWNGTDMSGARVGSGMYFLRFRGEGKELTTRVVVLGGGVR